MDDREYRFINVVESGALSVIQFRLAITARTTVIHEVQKEISDFVTLNGCQKLVIDLSSTAYLPSSIIGILAVLSTRGVEVHLANASRDVANVMEVTGLSNRIHVNKFALEVAKAEAKSATKRVPTAVIDGYFVSCSACDSQQRIDRHQLGKTAKCTNCHSPFHVDADLLQSATHVYTRCPVCERDLKLDPDVLAKTVNCEFCERQIRIRKIL